ncbi:hypothetical protein [Devosia sediminis]|uniref:DUF2066 domain-containing protein n=1 Tax=Devosia sediminis TaxID=2798801 RepID=A0A934IWE7_9HYPH|nr:hypothetical protein [Devosia sediminis]MBJ3784033.1 hypothetical protein [Devosia sediminis]
MRRLLATALILMAPATALAEDPLARFTPWFAANPSGLVFHYSAPLDGYAPGAPTLQGPSDDGLRSVMVAQQGVHPASGVDLDAIAGVLTVGGPPDELLVLMGPAAMSDHIDEALAGRGFEMREIAGVPVFGTGEDYAMDFASTGKPDPFGGGMGKAQRVALGDGFVAVARSWPGIETALKGLGKAKGGAVVWTATLDALAETRGDGHLDAAWGWGGDSFAGMLVDPAILLDGDIEEAIAAAQGGPQLLFPPFPLAIFALDRDGTRAHLRIALPYDRAEDAEAAASYVRHRLVEFPLVPSRPDIAIVPQGDLSIAVMTLTYAEADVAQANTLMLNWSSAVMQRSFTALQFGLF